VRAGLVPGDGGLVAWPLLLPLNIVKELLFTGRLLDAEEAARIGLVNRVVSADELEPEAMKLARDLAQLPQHALRFTKRVLNKVLEAQATSALDLGLALEAVTLGTQDHKDAVARFVARAK
jgi:enoyl-CoA hydratase